MPTQQPINTTFQIPPQQYLGISELPVINYSTQSGTQFLLTINALDFGIQVINITYQYSDDGGQTWKNAIRWTGVNPIESLNFYLPDPINGLTWMIKTILETDRPLNAGISGGPQNGIQPS